MVASDASNCDIGVAISDIFSDVSEKATSHAARLLTVTEQKYSQIEKEALQIAFAVKTFNKIIFGRHLTLITNHYPFLPYLDLRRGFLSTLLTGYNDGQQHFWIRTS